MKADVSFCVCGLFSVIELDFGPSHSRQVSVKDYINSRNSTTSLYKLKTSNLSYLE